MANEKNKVQNFTQIGFGQKKFSPPIKPKFNRLSHDSPNLILTVNKSEDDQPTATIFTKHPPNTVKNKLTMA